MLKLQFNVGEQRFAINYRHVIEIIPCIHFFPLPDFPEYIPGLIDYRGTPLLAVDFCQLIDHRSASKSMHSRMIILSNPDESSPMKFLGCIGEKVTGVFRKKDADFVSWSEDSYKYPFLGNVYNDDKGMIQLINVEKLLAYVQESLRSGITL